MLLEKRLEKVLQTLLGAFLFLLPWQTVYIYKDQFLNSVKWEYGTLDFYATELLFWLCAGLFMAWYVRRIKNHKLRITNVRWTKDRVFTLCCLGFVLYCFLTVAWAIDQDVALQHALRILEAFLLFFILFLGPLSPRIVGLLFVTGAALPSLLGIWQFLSQSTFGSALLGLAEHTVDAAGTSVIVGDNVGRWLRAYGTFPHPNMFGGYLALTIGVGLWLLRQEERRRTRLILHATLTVGTIALFFTFSRSAWVALTIMLLLYSCIIVAKKQWRLFVSIFSLLTCVSVLVVVFFPLIRVRTDVVSIHEQQSIDERVGGFQEATQLWKEHPWTGVGVGNYTAAVFAKDSTRPGWEYQPVHTAPLLLLVETGLMGAILLFGVVVSFFIYRSGKQPLIWYVFCVAGFAPLAFLDHYLLSSYGGLFFIAIVTAVGGSVSSTVPPQFIPWYARFLLE